MNKTKTLAQQVRWQLVYLGGGLLLACLVLLMMFAWRFMTVTSNSFMWLEAESLSRLSAENPSLTLPQNGSFNAYRHWQDIPENLRRHFPKQPEANAEILEAYRDLNGSSGEYLYLLRYSANRIDVNSREQDLFLLSRHSDDEIERIIQVYFSEALTQAMGSSLLIFVLLFFLASWVIKQTTQPIALLSQWSKRLMSDPESSIKQEFEIEELNQLAQQLRFGVDRVAAYNQREREFLQHASHELRTPLAVIQASLDTLELKLPKAADKTIARAQRASANMRMMSSTLLWLARDKEECIAKTPTDISELCQQSIEDHRYLLCSEKISIEVSQEPCFVDIEVELFKIVLANLMQNAFQYTSDGTIKVDFSHSSLTVCNDFYRDLESDATSSNGAGLGLQLVQRICTRLGWQYIYTESDGAVKVLVEF